MSNVDPLKTARSLLKQDEASQAQGLRLLRDVLRRGGLDPEGFGRAGRMLHAYWRQAGNEAAGGVAGPRPLRVLLLGQLTTSWLAQALTASAWARGIALRVEEGGYDTILQDLSTQTGGPDAPDLVVLVPWNQRLLGDEGARDPIGSTPSSASGGRRGRSSPAGWRRACSRSATTG